MGEYDVIVLGMGAMGASTCYHLAKRGQRVLGLERFSIPHTMGSSHGYSRVIRKAYFEHPDYVRLLIRAYELFDELEHASGEKLLYRTGGLYIGVPDGPTVGGTVRSAHEHKLPLESLTREQLATRFPQFRLRPDEVGVIETDAGFLIPERVVASHVEQALRRGAEVRAEEAVRHWEAGGAGVRVETDRGAYRARRLVITAGPWAEAVLGDLGVKLTVTRQVWGWVWPKRPELFALGRFPVFARDAPPPWAGQHYGVPMMPDNPGFKVALHHPLNPIDPDQVCRDVLPGDEETFRPLLRDVIPDADGPLLGVRVCLYTNSPDSHFILDTHPRHDNVVLACGFSGHGFKFCSVVGEAMADLAMHGKTGLPIDFLRLARFR